jgi:DNA-binding NtrC family response regulator
VADDTANIRQLLEAAFNDRGFDVTTASNGDQAVEFIGEQIFDVIITDMKMPGRDGIAVLRAAKQRSVDTAVIVVTAYGTMETAVEAMRLGAVDFIAKPFKLAEIELKVDKSLKARTDVPAPVQGSSAATASAEASGRIIGESTATAQLLKMIKKIGPSSSSVLITGQSGTGKELVAQELHYASERSDNPFIALNCAALAPGVLESELFGHEKGAFTGAAGKRVGRFERAHTGTLFLDEVGEIDPNIQTKLLRVLQEGEFERVGGTSSINVDVRVIAATNRDLREAIRQGLFREDFYYRLNVFSLALEPLANRRDDIGSLVEHFLKQFTKDTGKAVNELDDEVLNLFMTYPWPGNVRELQNILERASVLAEGPVITRDEIPQEMFLHPGGSQGQGSAALTPTVSATPSVGPTGSDPLSSQLDQLESETIYHALEKFRWNKTKAAEHLGLKRTTLQYKIKKYGLE